MAGAHLGIEEHSGYFLPGQRLCAGALVTRIAHKRLGPGWALFERPREILIAGKWEEVLAVVEAAEAATRQGKFAAGFLCYEAADAFDSALETLAAGDLPLAWFAIYDGPPEFFRELEPDYEPSRIDQLQWELTQAEYEAAFEQVRCALGEGATYETNLTFRGQALLRRSPQETFRSLAGCDPSGFTTYLDAGPFQVLSLSPELFFERDGLTVTSRPMKGTAARTGDRLADAELAQALSVSIKAQAENLMIVDMVRNDLGRVAETGSVSVPNLFEVERHPTVLQMTSTITARSNVSNSELLQALFPPASITGAPKASTMHLIKTLERSPRGLYTGCIGIMGPERYARFSVAIRTMVSRDGIGTYGVGSGLVWDSEPESEYEECLLKAEVLHKPSLQWELIDVMGPGALLDEDERERHVKRLLRSASEFGIKVDVDCLREQLQSALQSLGQGQKLRTRVKTNGTTEIECTPAIARNGQIRACLASRPVSSVDPNLRHKTTSRSMYSERLLEAPDFEEVLLYNELGEITEFCTGNVFVELDGRLFTPPILSGCLPGVARERLLETGAAGERRLFLNDLERATGVFFANSVVGLLPLSQLAHKNHKG